jgi:hypothetical protein
MYRLSSYFVQGKCHPVPPSYESNTPPWAAASSRHQTRASRCICICGINERTHPHPTIHHLNPRPRLPHNGRPQGRSDDSLTHRQRHYHELPGPLHEFRPRCALRGYLLPSARHTCRSRTRLQAHASMERQLAQLYLSQGSHQHGPRQSGAHHRPSHLDAYEGSTPSGAGPGRRCR